MKKKKVIKTNAVRMVEQAKIPYVIHEYDVDTAHLDALLQMEWEFLLKKCIKRLC